MVRLDETQTRANLAIVPRPGRNGGAPGARRGRTRRRGEDRLPGRSPGSASDPDVARVIDGRAQAVRDPPRPRAKGRRRSSASRSPSSRSKSRATTSRWRQGEGDRMDPAGAEGRARAVEQEPGAVQPRDGARARRRPAGGRARRSWSPRSRRPRARSPRPSCRSCRSTRTCAPRSARTWPRSAARSRSWWKAGRGRGPAKRVDIRRAAGREGLAPAGCAHGGRRDPGRASRSC